MSILQALVLGLVQGLTEFFPVSSTGHLLLAESLLHVPSHPQDSLAMIILLHAGTLLALVLCYARTWLSLLSSPFRNDKREVRMLLLLITATVPVAIIGFLFEDAIANIMESSAVLAMEFFINACVLLLGETYAKSPGVFARFFRRSPSGKTLSFSSAIGIGFSQALALSPALSRSGLTITAGRFAGLSRREALDFSFLMATPAIAGAVLLMVAKIASGGMQLPPMSVTLTGFCASFLSSVFAIMFLRAFASKYSFSWFALYLFCLSVFVLMR